MHEWLLERLPAMAAGGVKPWPAPLLTIDRAWAEQLYATEPDGAPDEILARRLGLEMLEFAIETLREENNAAGKAEDFRRLLPRLRIVAGEQRDPAVAEFRQRFGATLQVLVADIIAEPREVNAEVAILAGATKMISTGSIPEIFGALTPDELFAWALAAPVVAPRNAVPVPVCVAPVLVVAAPGARVPSSRRRSGRWMAAGSAVVLAALAGVFALLPQKEKLSYAQKMELARAAQTKVAAVAEAAKPTPRPKLAETVRSLPTPVPAPVPEPETRAETRPETPAPLMAIVAPTPTPVPVPALVPTAAPAPVSEFVKWLTTTFATMGEAYDREVRGPFDSGVAAALRQYVSVIDAGIASADAAGKRDTVLALRLERQRVVNGQAMADDSTVSIPELKPLRTQWQAQFSKLDKERYDRAKALHGRFDPALAQQEARLIKQGNSEDAGILKAKRDEIAAAWLVPPSAPASNVAPVRTAPPPSGRLAPLALLSKLLALNARVVVRDNPKTTSHPVLTPLDLKSEKFEIKEVEFRARPVGGAPVTDADLAILDQLQNLHDLAITGIAVTDDTIARIHACRELHHLRLENLQTITGKSLEVLSSLPELRSLALVNLPLGDDAITIVAQLSKLTKLRVNNLPITDASFAALTSIAGLEDLEFGGGKIKVASGSWANVVAMRKLTHLIGRGEDLDADVVGQIARCTHLTRLKLEGSGITDAALTSVSALTHLTSLDVSKTKVSGACFKKWPARHALETLKMDECPSLDDAVLHAIVASFPKLQTLELSGSAGAITTAGAAACTRLRGLTALKLVGEIASDAIAAEIARIETLTQLNLGKAKITESGLSSLARLPKLGKLNLSNPPITDGALKALKKFRALKEITIGTETQEAIFNRLRADLPGVTIHR